jgi:hypothetical protein
VLVDAAGVASLLTTNEACVVEAPDEDKPVGVQSHPQLFEIFNVE